MSNYKVGFKNFTTTLKNYIIEFFGSITFKTSKIHH